MPKHQINYLKAVVIVHGKSEKQICEYIRSNLRLKIEIYSEKAGGKSIQITGLNRILGNSIFKSKKDFLKVYPDAEKGKNKIPSDFKLFIIMDTDDCSIDQKKRFINKEMFRNSWLHDYIIPIYNSANLEDVLKRAKIPYSNEKSDYIKLFPTNHEKKGQFDEIQELHRKLKSTSDTNLDVLIEFCLNNVEKK